MVDDVVVDASEQEGSSLRLPLGWLLGLGAGVVLALALLPGHTEPAQPSNSVSVRQVDGGEDRWRPVDLPGGGLLRDVASVSDGSYVAVGDGPQAWRYEDETWTWVLDDSDLPGSMMGVAAYREGAVAVGHDSLDDSVTEAAIWKTWHGRDWRRASLDAGRPSGLDGVFVAGSEAVAWGWRGSVRGPDTEREPVLLRTYDGDTWRVVGNFGGSDRSVRLFTVTRHEGAWYAGGYDTGRPALWSSSDDMETWERIDTGTMPSGWSVVDVNIAGDVGTAILLDNGEGRLRRVLHRDGAWVPADESAASVVPMAGSDEGQEVGGGSLWIGEGEGWEALELSGWVTAVSGRVAVGGGPDMQPRAWIREGPWAVPVRVPQAGSGHWQRRQSLGSLSDFLGAWRVAGGWVIGAEDRWWYLGRDWIESFTPPWGDPFSAIVPVGEEWVALPSMHWTSDGTNWEERGQPWTREEVGPVEAVTESGGRLWAIGRDTEDAWNGATSSDAGRSWTPVDPPMTSASLRAVAGTPEGFVATVGRPGDTQEVVASADGRTWDTVTRGRLLPGAQPPTALTDRGTLLPFDTDEEIRPPRTDITFLVRKGDGLVLVAGGRLWAGDGEWEEIPLDPPHGMRASRVHPLAIGDQVLALGLDRGAGLVVHEWQAGHGRHPVRYP